MNYKKNSDIIQFILHYCFLNFDVPSVALTILSGVPKTYTQIHTHIRKKLPSFRSRLKIEYLATKLNTEKPMEMKGSRKETKDEQVVDGWSS